MKMFEVEVSANSDGEILIVQPRQRIFGIDDMVIYLAPEQVETLIEWLRTMRDTVINNPHEDDK